MLERPLFLPHKILQGVDVNTWGQREEGCEKSHLRDRLQNILRYSYLARCMPSALDFGQMHMHAASAYSCHLVFPSTPSAFDRMYRVRGSGLETTKDSLHQCSLVLVPNPPLAPPAPPTFLSPPLFSPISLSLSPNFPSPLSIRPPPPAPFLLSYRRRRRPCVWFWAQMALACLWRWIKPPVSPFASMCKWSGQRTSNKGKGGRNARGEKKNTLQDCETTPDADVSRHSWKGKLKRL